MEGRRYYLAATYIAEGLLDEIVQRRFRLRVVSGGEVGLGYCHASLADLGAAIDKRAAAFAPLLQKYRGILELAGTMTLWRSRGEKRLGGTGNLLERPRLRLSKNMIPYMELLFRSYR